MRYALEDIHPRRRVWVRESNIPRRFIGLTVDDLAPYRHDEVMTTVREWLESFNNSKVVMAESSDDCGLGLLFTGDPGHGKTTLACAVLNTLARDVPEAALKGKGVIRPFYFARYPDILRLKGRLMNGNDENDQRLMDGLYGECKEDAYNVRVLVLDDLGHEYASRWTEDNLDHLLRVRYDKGLPTIVTSNVELDRWAGLYGEATESFGHEALVPLSIVSPNGDRRR